MAVGGSVPLGTNLIVDPEGCGSSDPPREACRSRGRRRSRRCAERRSNERFSRERLRLCQRLGPIGHELDRGGRSEDLHPSGLLQVEGRGSSDPPRGSCRRREKRRSRRCAERRSNERFERERLRLCRRLGPIAPERDCGGRSEDLHPSGLLQVEGCGSSDPPREACRSRGRRRSRHSAERRSNERFERERLRLCQRLGPIALERDCGGRSEDLHPSCGVAGSCRRQRSCRSLRHNPATFFPSLFHTAALRLP